MGSTSTCLPTSDDLRGRVCGVFAESARTPQAYVVLQQDRGQKVKNSIQNSQDSLRLAHLRKLVEMRCWLWSYLFVDDLSDISAYIETAPEAAAHFEALSYKYWRYLREAADRTPYPEEVFGVLFGIVSAEAVASHFALPVNDVRDLVDGARHTALRKLWNEVQA